MLFVDVGVGVVLRDDNGKPFLRKFRRDGLSARTVEWLQQNRVPSHLFGNADVSAARQTSEILEDTGGLADGAAGVPSPGTGGPHAQQLPQPGGMAEGAAVVLSPATAGTHAQEPAQADGLAGGAVVVPSPANAGTHAQQPVEPRGDACASHLVHPVV